MDNRPNSNDQVSPERIYKYSLHCNQETGSFAACRIQIPDKTNTYEFHISKSKKEIKEEDVDYSSHEQEEMEVSSPTTPTLHESNDTGKFNSPRSSPAKGKQDVKEEEEGPRTSPKQWNSPLQAFEKPSDWKKEPFIPESSSNPSDYPCWTRPRDSGGSPCKYCPLTPLDLEDSASEYPARKASDLLDGLTLHMEIEHVMQSCTPVKYYTEPEDVARFYDTCKRKSASPVVEKEKGNRISPRGSPRDRICCQPLKDQESPEKPQESWKVKEKSPIIKKETAKLPSPARSNEISDEIQESINRSYKESSEPISLFPGLDKENPKVTAKNEQGEENFQRGRVQLMINYCCHGDQCPKLGKKLSKKRDINKQYIRVHARKSKISRRLQANNNISWTRRVSSCIFQSASDESVDSDSSLQ